MILCERMCLQLRLLELWISRACRSETRVQKPPIRINEWYMPKYNAHANVLKHECVCCPIFNSNCFAYTVVLWVSEWSVAVSHFFSFSFFFSVGHLTRVVVFRSWFSHQIFECKKQLILQVAVWDLRIATWWCLMHEAGGRATSQGRPRPPSPPYRRSEDLATSMANRLVSLNMTSDRSQDL